MTINKIVIIFTFSFFSLVSLSQNLTCQYYSYINKADSLLIIKKDTANALNNYLKGLEYVKYKPSIIKQNYWILCLKLAYIKGKSNQANLILTDFIKHGLHKEMYNFYKIDERLLYKFFKSSKCKLIEQGYDSLYKIYLNNIDYELESEMFSLLNQDKFSREIDRTPNIYNYADSNTLNNIFELIYLNSDCDIKFKLQSILNKIDTLSTINYSKTISGVVFLMLHNLRNFANPFKKDSFCIVDEDYYKKLKPILFNLVQSGYLENNEYAYLIDRAHCWNNFSGIALQIYGTHTENGKLMYPIFDIENVDKRRSEIFLPSLYQASVIEGFELPKEYIYRK